METIKGPTIRIMSGRYFNLESPDPNSFGIDDIAHALSNLCRYTGHCETFYSVAQHSALVSYLVPPEDALAGLLHDAAEAFIGDVAKPLKALLPDYQRIEARIERVIFEKFGLPTELPPSVKHADLVMLRTEQRDLMHAGDHNWTWTAGVQPHPWPVVPMVPLDAHVFFMKRYWQITSRTRTA